MDSSKKITYIDEISIKNKRVLLRVDFNVSMNKNRIADDARMRLALPTLEYLLSNNNRLIVVSHFGRPKGKRDEKFSLKKISAHLQELLPQAKILLVEDFESEKGEKEISEQKANEVVLLENIRFYKGEEDNNPGFAKKLASFADIYVNDAFGVSHRAAASIVGVTKYLPSYGGLLLKKEVEMIGKLIDNPRKPFVAIIGGAKISTKIKLLTKLIEITDFLLLGGGIANTFLYALGYQMGKSLVEKDEAEDAKKLLFHAAQKNTAVILPEDAIVGNKNDDLHGGQVVRMEDITRDMCVLDIGPETQAKFGNIILMSNTIVWNGPMGYMENPQFARGSDFLFYTIAQNANATSIVGGGETLASISKKEHLDAITHISSGGGAMLEFIEKGTLPGLEALKK